MTDVRTRYLSAARTGLDLLTDPAVAAHWDEPSALEGFTVGGLATHLAAQLTAAAKALDADYDGKDVIGVFEHFDRAAWVGADPSEESNAVVVTLAEAAAALADLQTRLPHASADALGGTPRWPYATSLDDYLLTRIMEIVVHVDDLAYSTGLDTPAFDQDAFDTAAWILARLAAKRHGQTALVRALARAERAPASISGL